MRAHEMRRTHSNVSPRSSAPALLGFSSCSTGRSIEMDKLREQLVLRARIGLELMEERLAEYHTRLAALKDDARGCPALIPLLVDLEEDILDFTSEIVQARERYLQIVDRWSSSH